MNIGIRILNDRARYNMKSVEWPDTKTDHNYKANYFLHDISSIQKTGEKLQKKDRVDVSSAYGKSIILTIYNSGKRQLLVFEIVALHWCNYYILMGIYKNSSFFFFSFFVSFLVCFLCAFFFFFMN